MKHSTHPLVASLLCLPLCLALGCSGDDAASDDGAGTDPTADDGGSSTGDGTVVVSGTITDFLDMVPVVGANMCIRGQADVGCTDTDAEGNYLLEGVAVGDLIVELTHADYPNHLAHGTVTQDTGIGVLAINRNVAALLVQQAGGTIDPALGAIAMAAYDAEGVGVVGATATLSPDDAELPVIYLDADGVPDPAATETSTSGYFGFANVAPGTHTLVVSHPTLTCTSAYDLDGSGATIQVEVDTISNAFSYTCQ